MKIAIVLSTYNGEKYISEQLDSILNQTYQNFMLYIRDDGSKDSTISIIQKYQKTNPTKITFIQDDLGNLHVFDSFKQLLLHSSGDYYVFCDQDDIWTTNKLKVMQKRMKEREIANPEKAILLAHDYRVFDSSGIIIQSVHQQTKLKQKEVDRGLFQGFIAGCTTMFNKQAKDLYLRYSKIGIHDKHIVNLLNVFGEVHLIPDKLINYRIHDGNTVGLKKRQSTIVLFKDLFRYLFKKKEYHKLILKEYFYMQNEMAKQIESDLLIKKEYFSSTELLELGFFKRKAWFLNHFKPFSTGFIEGTITTLLI